MSDLNEWYVKITKDNLDDIKKYRKISEVNNWNFKHGITADVDNIEFNHLYISSRGWGHVNSTGKYEDKFRLDNMSKIISTTDFRAILSALDTPKNFYKGDFVVVETFEGRSNWSKDLWFQPDEVMKIGGQFIESKLDASGSLDCKEGLAAICKKYPQGGGMFNSNYTLRHARPEEIRFHFINLGLVPRAKITTASGGVRTVNSCNGLNIVLSNGQIRGYEELDFEMSFRGIFRFSGVTRVKKFELKENWWVKIPEDKIKYTEKFYPGLFSNCNIFSYPINSSPNWGSNPHSGGGDGSPKNEITFEQFDKHVLSKMYIVETEESNAYELPELWCIKDCEEVSNWASNEHGCGSLPGPEGYFYHNKGTNGDTYAFGEERVGFTRIDIDTFRKYVSKIDTTEDSKYGVMMGTCVSKSDPYIDEPVRLSVKSAPRKARKRSTQIVIPVKVINNQINI